MLLHKNRLNRANNIDKNMLFALFFIYCVFIYAIVNKYAI